MTAGPLGLDPVLLEILACPAPDHGELRPGTPDDESASALTCASCGRSYP
ncbi:MAG TPA: Trm112 family protein, partial [Acidimicrobiia bacterium]